MPATPLASPCGKQKQNEKSDLGIALGILFLEDIQPK